MIRPSRPNPMRYLGDVTLDELGVFIDRRILVVLERIERKLDRVLELDPDEDVEQ